MHLVVLDLGRQIEREETEVYSLCVSSLPRRAATTKAGPEPRASSRSPVWLAGAQGFGLSFVAFEGHHQGPGWGVGQPGY